MVIDNHIFDAYRARENKIKEAIQLLESNGYIVNKINNHKANYL